jgi:lipoprotein-anchoring transpeptidase ErfK/SrfK
MARSRLAPSARSAVLTDWPDGGFVGIHGTNQPELLPGRVSHGCIRMRNEDIVELGRSMPIGDTRHDPLINSLRPPGAWR